MNESSIRTYAENELKSWDYYINRIEWCEDRLKMLDSQLSGDVHSPRIKSPEEAKYQSGTKIYQNNIIELMEREKYVKLSLEEFKTHLERIERFFNSYANSQAEKQIIERVYRYRHTATQVARSKNVSRQYIHTVLSGAVEAFAVFIEADMNKRG